MKRRVAITGLGAVSPLGVGAGELIGRWADGASGIADGEGRCADFDPADHLSRKELRRADRFTQMALTASGEALAQAGFNGEKPVPAERTACVIGTGIGGIGTIEEQHLVLEHKGAAQVSPLAIPLLMANAASGSVAMKNDLRGQCYGVVSACAAGAHAIGAGVRMIQYGDADACLVGGSEAAITPLASAAFGSMAAISPTGESRPFDARRDGFVMGEGAGALMLEDEEAARERGARDPGGDRGLRRHRRRPPPDRPRAQRRRRRARHRRRRWRTPASAPGDIDYVNAHGTSTPLNDRAETEALQTALGDHAGEIPVSSLKSSIGHLLGAAGAVEAVATALALERGVAPPTVGWEQRDEGMDLDYVPDSARPLEADGDRPLRAISNSFGFGGHNAVLCIEAALVNPGEAAEAVGLRAADAAGDAVRPGHAAAGAHHGRGAVQAQPARRRRGGGLGPRRRPHRVLLRPGLERGGRVAGRLARRLDRARDGDGRPGRRADRGLRGVRRRAHGRGRGRAGRLRPIFRAQVELSGRVPQISVVSGTSAGGGAYSPALADFVVMAPEASMFLTGPGVVNEVMGEDVTGAELGGPEVHARNGVSHLSARSDVHAVLLARELLGYLSGGGRAGAARGRRPRGHGARPPSARSTTCARWWPPWSTTAARWRPTSASPRTWSPRWAGSRAARWASCATSPSGWAA